MLWHLLRNTVSTWRCGGNNYCSIGRCPLRSLVTSVLRPNWTSNSVLDHFGPKDRTDLATLVLSKPKLSQCYIHVSVFCEVSFCHCIGGSKRGGAIRPCPHHGFRKGLLSRLENELLKVGGSWRGTFQLTHLRTA